MPSLPRSLSWHQLSSHHFPSLPHRWRSSNYGRTRQFSFVCRCRDFSCPNNELTQGLTKVLSNRLRALFNWIKKVSSSIEMKINGPSIPLLQCAILVLVCRREVPQHPLRFYFLLGLWMCFNENFFLLLY